MKRLCVCGLLALSMFLSSVVAEAASVKLSIAIRETNVAGAIFDNGGASGGIEFVNRDGQALVDNGTWQLFTFTPATDTLTAFAGTTANSMLEAGHEWAVLEQIRVLNDEGITLPIRLWIDDVTNTTAAGSTVQDFESSTLGTEVMFQEPGFSGSTSTNLVAGSTSAVSNSMANSGSQSIQMDMQFVDADPTRWARVTTFNTPNQPNPIVRITVPGAGAPTISFYAKMAVIPEPTSMLLVGAMSLAAACLRPRW